MRIWYTKQNAVLNDFISERKMTRHEHLVKTKLLKYILGFTKNIQGLMEPLGRLMYVSSGMKWAGLCFCNSVSKSTELQARIRDCGIDSRMEKVFAKKKKKRYACMYIYIYIYVCVCVCVCVCVLSIRSGCCCFCTSCEFSAYMTLFNSDFKLVLHTWIAAFKIRNLLKIFSPSGHPRYRWVCFFIRTHLAKCSITSLAHQWILCRWMGAVRMRVQTADKKITIIHTLQSIN